MSWHKEILQKLKERDKQVIENTQIFLDKNDCKIFIEDNHEEYTIFKLYSKEGFNRFLIYNYTTLIDPF